MKIIKSNETREETENSYIIHMDGFDQLIEARKNGEFAIWEYDEFIITTDDIPDDVEQLDLSEVKDQMKNKAYDRYERLKAAKEQSTGHKGLV